MEPTNTTQAPSLRHKIENAVLWAMMGSLLICGPIEYLKLASDSFLIVLWPLLTSVIFILLILPKGARLIRALNFEAAELQEKLTDAGKHRSELREEIEKVWRELALSKKRLIPELYFLAVYDRVRQEKHEATIDCLNFVAFTGILPGRIGQCDPPKPGEEVEYSLSNDLVIRIRLTQGETSTLSAVFSRKVGATGNKQDVLSVPTLVEGDAYRIGSLLVVYTGEDVAMAYSQLVLAAHPKTGWLTKLGDDADKLRERFLDLSRSRPNNE